MYISKLSLSNYRNYQREEFNFSKGINIISGNNAQGKTNCAEAIFFLCTGYSPRVTREKQVINSNAQSAKITAIAHSDNMGKISAEIEFSCENSKKIMVNGVPASKTGELIGNINSVMFDPQQLKLVQESPEDRRRFMDIALSQMDRKYFYNLQKYKKILAQRNMLLKDRDRELIYATLPAWDEQFALYASSIIYERNNFLDMLKPFSKEAHAKITNGKEDLSIGGDYKFTGTRAEIAEQLIEELKERTDKDIDAGFTTVGPHRDDIKIKINDLDARVYSSQGQQRTAALSLKLGEVNIFKEHFGEYPVLILDDAMSELDSVRRECLLSMLDGVQTLITCTDAEKLNIKGSRHFFVENGKIVKQEDDE